MNQNPCSYCGQEVGTAGCPNLICTSKMVALGNPLPRWAPPVSISPLTLDSLELSTWKHRYFELLKDNELQHRLVQELRVELHKTKKDLESHSLGELRREIDELKQWKRRHDETHDKLVASSINNPTSLISKPINFRNLKVEYRKI